jgi:hypothetical protein
MPENHSIEQSLDEETLDHTDAALDILEITYSRIRRMV